MCSVDSVTFGQPFKRMTATITIASKTVKAGIEKQIFKTGAQKRYTVSPFSVPSLE